jgi:hypothetical protein
MLGVFVALNYSSFTKENVIEVLNQTISVLSK